jgi:hypothetical protein
VVIDGLRLAVYGNNKDNRRTLETQRKNKQIIRFLHGHVSSLICGNAIKTKIANLKNNCGFLLEIVLTQRRKIIAIKMIK